MLPLSVHDLNTIIWETILMASFLGLAWFVGKYCTGENFEK